MPTACTGGLPAGGRVLGAARESDQIGEHRVVDDRLTECEWSREGVERDALLPTGFAKRDLEIATHEKPRATCGATCVGRDLDELEAVAILAELAQPSL